MALIDIKVPDIGDFKEVAVIEVLVKPGDTVKAEQSLITVESDKASMEIPSSAAGVVKELKVKVGDKVAEGSVVLSLETGAAAAPAPAAAPSALAAAPAAAPAAPSSAPAPAAASYAGAADLECDMLVLGAGPGGYSAAFRAADLGMKTVLVERYPTLGGVCLNVGCIPSKALLHVAAVMDEAAHFADLGIEFAAPKIDLTKLLAHKNKVVGKLTEQVYDLVLQAVGRVPNGKRIGAEKAGVIVSDRGFIPVDVQMRTNVPHIYAIGDIVGQPMLAHKAVHEAHVAAEVASGDTKAQFDARVIPSVAYTDPEVAWVGLTEDEAKAQGVKVKKGLFPWTASGRAIANGRDEGFTKLLFDAETHRILGGGIVGTHAGDMIGEVALAIEMGADEVDIGKTIHPHPTLGESIGMAAEIAHGTCTDVPPPRK